MYVKVLFILEDCVFFVFFCDFWAKKRSHPPRKWMAECIIVFSLRHNIFY